MLTNCLDDDSQLPAPGDFVAELSNRQQVLAIQDYVSVHFDEIDRALFRMLLVEGHSHKTAAAALGITVWNSQKRLERIRKRIREAFSDF